MAATPVATMKVVTIREFRDKATQLMRSGQPVFVTRNGKAAGLYIPLYADGELPFEFKRGLFMALTDEVKSRLEARGLTEDDVLAKLSEAVAALPAAKRDK